MIRDPFITRANHPLGHGLVGIELANNHGHIWQIIQIGASWHHVIVTGTPIRILHDRELTDEKAEELARAYGRELPTTEDI